MIVIILTLSLICYQELYTVEEVEARTGTITQSTVKNEWNTTFEGKTGISASSVIQTSDGGYAIAVGDSGDTDLVKIDKNGKYQWNHTYRNSSSDALFSIIQTTDGGFALAGRTSYYSNITSVYDFDMWLVKTNSTGYAEWNSSFGDANPDEAYSLIQTSDGGFVIAGYKTSYGPGKEGMWLVKTDMNGQYEWNKTFGREPEKAYSLIQTSDGGYALAGSIFVKTDADGLHEWNRTFGGGYIKNTRSVIQTFDGGYALAGYVWISEENNSFDMFLVKTNTTGHEIWNNTIGGTKTDEAYALIQTSDKGYALAGYTDSYGAGNTDMWLVKTDTNGQHQWNITFGGAGSEMAISMIQTSDGGVVIAGGTTSYGSGIWAMWIVKLGSISTNTSPSWALIIVLMSLLMLVPIKKRILSNLRLK